MNTNTLPESRRHNGATHSFGEKLASWRTRPAVSLRLLMIIALLLLVAVAAVTQRHHLTDWQPAFQQLVNTVADLWEYNRS
jgi:hypothetical protein